MAGHNSRELTIDWDSTTLVGVQSKTVSVSNELVDVTTDDDNGWQTHLENPGVRGVEVSISGISSDEVLLAAMMQVNVTNETVTANLPTSLATSGTVSASFGITSYEQNGGSSDGAVEFSATFKSSGVVTYVASSA